MYEFGIQFGYMTCCNILLSIVTNGGHFKITQGPSNNLNYQLAVVCLCVPVKLQFTSISIHTHICSD